MGSGQDGGAFGCNLLSLRGYVFRIDLNQGIAVGISDVSTVRSVLQLLTWR